MIPTRQSKKRRFSWFFLVLILVIAYFSSIMISQQMYLSQVSEDQEAAEQRLVAARQENETLRQERENLNRMDYIEKLAREELGMTREGELPYSPGGAGRKQAQP